MIPVPQKAALHLAAVAIQASAYLDALDHGQPVGHVVAYYDMRYRVARVSLRKSFYRMAASL